MQAQLREGHAPAVVVSLEPGEELVSEAGATMFISGDVSLDAELAGGLAGALKRSVLAGESLFLVHMTGPGHVTLQTLPFARTADRIIEAARGGGPDERSGLLNKLLES